MCSLEIKAKYEIHYFFRVNIWYTFFILTLKKVYHQRFMNTFGKEKYADSVFTPDLPPTQPDFYPNPTPVCLNRSNFCVFLYFQKPIKGLCGTMWVVSGRFLSQDAVPRRPDNHL